MTIRLPLAETKKHGAQLIESDNGFRVKAASGAVLALPGPPVPWLLEHENPASAPKSTWAAQKSIETYVEFDAGITSLKGDDSISEIERTRRRLKLVEKTQSALEHIERDFAAEEAEVEANEKAHYSWPAIQADDIVGALRDNEIRTALRAMPKSALDPLLHRLNDGEERAVLEAVLRSPFEMGLMSQFAMNGWRILRDREDPQKRAGLELRKSYNDWGRRIVGAVQGTLAAKLRG